MTTEEKAKAYDEALKWMRELYPGLHGATKEDAEHYFPELRESEDERIRRELIEYLRGDLDDITTDDTDRWISWLEKQKEQNLAEVIKDRRQIAFMVEEGRMCGEIEGRKQVIDNPEKYGLQKPAEWSDDDEQMIWEIVGVLEADNVENKKKFPYALSLHERYKKMVDWLKSLRPSWKPSEEHLSALLAVFNDPNNIGSQTCQLALTDLYEQLKKL